MTEEEASIAGRRPTRPARAAAVLVVAAAVWFALAGHLVVETDPVGSPDAVFALSGDPLGDRAARAIRVAATTDAHRLVFFVDGGPTPNSPSELEGAATRAGVPPEAIAFVPGVTSTAQEAGLAAGLVDRCGWDRIAVVTSAFHTRRAGWTFERAIDGAAQVAMVAPDDGFDATGWWRTEIDRRSVLREWPKAIASSWYLVRPPPAIDSDVPC